VAPYVATPPIPRRIAHRVNVSVLLVADSLLLLPMLTARLVAPARADTFAAIIFQGMTVSAMGLSALAAQLALVERNWPALPLGGRLATTHPRNLGLFGREYAGSVLREQRVQMLSFYVFLRLIPGGARRRNEPARAKLHHPCA
jgi:hypothetical protein